MKSEQKETEKREFNESINGDYSLDNTGGVTRNVSKLELEKKSFENLKNYLHKLLRMQNEKE